MSDTPAALVAAPDLTTGTGIVTEVDDRGIARVTIDRAERMLSLIHI